ncbi:MAG: ATP-binding protein [Victivallaceae bacterium]|jgi:signal transduction histidine kinase|nr:ATP-binding protein [Victivallaceae bacterium]
MPKPSFIERLIQRVDSLDSRNLQSFLLKIYHEKGFLDSLLEAMQEGILVIDRQLRIIYHNHAASEILGLPENLEKVRLSQFLQNVDWRRIMELDEDEWIRLSSQEVEILYPVHRYVHFYLMPHGAEDGLGTVILRDITESRTSTLNELEAETDRAVSMLAAEVAHEIGNPLNSLYLNLQLLQQELSEAGDGFNREEAIEMAKIARSEVERLDNIINQFLHAIRPGKPKMMPLDLKVIVKETLAFMHQELENRSVWVDFEYPEAIPMVSGDGPQLKQTFYNIIKNAIQAMPEGGKLKVIYIYDDDFVTLEFADTGQGISVSELSKLFQPFHTTKSNGSGIGMMIVNRVMREHGASISLQTLEGKGTSIMLRFPRIGRRLHVLPTPPNEYGETHEQ